MTAYNTPSGSLLALQPILTGSTTVLTPVPDTPTSFGFTDPFGVLLQLGTPTPSGPTKGQGWP